VFFYVTDSGDWGVQDSIGNPLPLPISVGGTGANTLLGARVNLGVEQFGSDSTRSTMSAPNAAAYAFVTNTGDWGLLTIAARRSHLLFLVVVQEQQMQPQQEQT
jgi:hypothetical protein